LVIHASLAACGAMFRDSGATFVNHLSSSLDQNNALSVVFLAILSSHWIERDKFGGLNLDCVDRLFIV